MILSPRARRWKHGSSAGSRHAEREKGGAGRILDVNIPACAARPVVRSGGAMLRPAGGFCRAVEHLRDVAPIDEMIDERLEIVRPPVAIVDVVGVLPDVAAENGT